MICLAAAALRFLASSLPAPASASCIYDIRTDNSPAGEDESRPADVFPSSSDQLSDLLFPCGLSSLSAVG